jgi:hypothetical protein
MTAPDRIPGPGPGPGPGPALGELAALPGLKQVARQIAPVIAGDRMRCQGSPLFPHIVCPKLRTASGPRWG